MRLGYVILAAAILGLPLAGCGKDDPKGFSKVDYNKDGKVIFEELIVAFPDLTVDEFLAADADRNGSIDEKEFKAFRAARESGKKLATAAQPAEEAPPVTEPLAPAAAAPGAVPATSPSPAPSGASDKVPGEVPSATASEPAAPLAADTLGASEPAKSPATSAAPSGAAVEKVETVVAAPAAKASPKEPASYTVQRGDSLSRIAKKYSVDVKALMAANKLKDAKQLQTGAVLVIPGDTAPAAAATQAAPVEVTAFVTGYFDKDASGDINGLIDLYEPKIEYRGKAKTGSDLVRQDKAALFLRWPERSYKPGSVTVEALAGGDLRVTAPVSYTYAKDGKSQQGDAVWTLVLRPKDGGYRILAEEQKMTTSK